MAGTALEMAGMDRYMQLQQDQVPFKVRAKRGCATHPRSIAERVRDVCTSSYISQNSSIRVSHVAGAIIFTRDLYIYGAGEEDEDQREAQEAPGPRAQHGQGNYELLIYEL